MSVFQPDLTPVSTGDLPSIREETTQAARPPRSLNIIGARNWFFLASLVVIIPGIISMATQGFLLGIDFQGGTQFQLKFSRSPDLAQVQSAVSAQGVNGVVQQTANGSYLIRTGSIDPQHQAQFESALETRLGAIDQSQTQVANVGPMLPSGVLAVSASSVGLLQPLHESRGTTSWEIDSGRLVPAPSDVQVAAGTNGALITPTRPDPIGIDLVAEVSTGWLPEIEGLLAVWSPDTSGTESGVDSGPPAERFPMLRDDLLPESRTVQRADLSVPLGVGVLATLGYRLRRPLLKWLYRRSASPVSLLPSRPMAIRNGKRSRVSPHV